MINSSGLMAPNINPSVNLFCRDDLLLSKMMIPPVAIIVMPAYRVIHATEVIMAAVINAFLDTVLQVAIHCHHEQQEK